MKLFSLKSLLILFAGTLFSANAQEISKTLIGTNYWYKNLTPKVFNLTQQAGVKIIRIGGADYDKNMPSNETLLQWVSKIQEIGAQPILQVSQYQSAQKAAEIVRFFNIEKHQGVNPIKYWNIGNEPWLQANKPSLATFGATVEAYFKPIAAAMKAVDPTIKIYGPDFCDYLDQPVADLFGGKNDITIKVPGKNYYYCDGLAWHRYPQSSADPATVGAEDILARIIKSKNLVDKINKQNNRNGEDALHWAIGEFNSKGGPEVHTFGNGQMFAAVLAYCMEYGAIYATNWSMFENGGNRKETDFSMFDGKNLIPRSSTRHMELIAKHFTGKFIKGNSPDADVMIFGTKNGTEISVMIMNRGYNGIKEYSISSQKIKAPASTLNLTINSDLNKIYTDKIAPRTTQVLIFKGNNISKIIYSSDDFDKNEAPKTIQNDR